jgi:hypothetical protein
MPVARGIAVLAGVAAAPSRRTASPVGQRLRQQALALAADEGLGQGSFSYRIVPLDGPAGEVLHVGGERLEAPWLLPKQGFLTALACGVCTLGTALEQRVAELFGARRRALALALDSLGNELLAATSQRMRHRMVGEAARRGLSIAGELRSGDPGLALDSQAAVLRLAEGTQLGIGLSRGTMMDPVKSISAVFGVGIGLAEADWSRCDHCRWQGRCGFAGQTLETRCLPRHPAPEPVKKSVAPASLPAFGEAETEHFRRSAAVPGAEAGLTGQFFDRLANP